MICPRCGNQLSEITVEGITLDICKGGCAGIWFDNFELEKLDEPHEQVGEVLLHIEKADHGRTVKVDDKIQCPRCENMPMLRHFFSVSGRVQIDECPNCAGVWLDDGELQTIRSLFESTEERHQAAEEYFMQVFGDQIARSEAEDQARVEKVRRFANMFRFLCPSYYIPGKQSWGAF